MRFVMKVGQCVDKYEGRPRRRAGSGFRIEGLSGEWEGDECNFPPNLETLISLYPWDMTLDHRSQSALLGRSHPNAAPFVLWERFIIGRSANTGHLPTWQPASWGVVPSLAAP